MDPLERIRLELNDALELLNEDDNETAAEHIRSVLDILDEITLPGLGEPLDLERERMECEEDDEPYHEEPSYLMRWDER